MSSAIRKQNQKDLVFYFQVHQPRRLRTLRFFDIGANRSYFDDDLNRDIIQRIARNCYLPTNALLLKLIKRFPHIRIAFSISGVAMDQFDEYAPEVIDSFRRLAETGSVDFLTETYYHSLSSLIPGNEFELQVAKHEKKIRSLFGIHSKVFRNTELIYSDQTGERIRQLGFKGVVIDGIDRILDHHHPHQVFESPHVSNLKMLLRNYRLSDDISFRFLQGSSTLTVEQYVAWLEGIPSHERIVTLAMDYETFGEHQKKETGIFSFLENLFTRLARSRNFGFVTPSGAVEGYDATGKLQVPGFVSWADEERDLSAWLGNEMQRDAFDSLVRLEADVKAVLDKDILRQWRALQTSDHFYYMSTKKGSDGDVHHYFSPYPSPYEAFINYMNVLTDFALRVKIQKATGIFTRPVAEVALPNDALEVHA